MEFHEKYGDGDSVVSYNLPSLVNDIKEIGKKHTIAVIGITAHWDGPDGEMSIGSKSRRQTPLGKKPYNELTADEKDEVLKYSVGLENVDEFARKIKKAFEGQSKPGLIVLHSCCLGCRTKADGDTAVKSFIQKFANETGIPVLAPVGYGGGLLPHETRNADWNYRSTRFFREGAFLGGGLGTHPKIDNPDYHDSEEGVWSLTLPDDQTDFGGRKYFVKVPGIKQ